VSAALIAAWNDVASRISPTMMMSGSCRSTCFRPVEKLCVSRPISRCSTTDWLSSNTNSIGSSRVTTCFLKLAFTYSIMAASVVDLPEPVVPATSTMPRGLRAISLITGDSPNSVKLGTCVFT